MHLETFLYMLLQSPKVLPPPGRANPDFESMAQQAALKREINEWHQIPATSLQIGINDPEDKVLPVRYYGWDNERPARKVDVAGFKAQSRCISIGEYTKFLEDTKRDKLPVSWLEVSGDIDDLNGDLTATAYGTVDMASSTFLRGKAVRTVYGPIALRLTLDWPVMASYDELTAYAQWANGRIPSFEEARSIYHYVESQKVLPVEIPNALVSAVNG
jgi:formylglycine-generating enzyme required for sulfatase activity